jgi:hypothetical protein
VEITIKVTRTAKIKVVRTTTVIATNNNITVNLAHNLCQLSNRCQFQHLCHKCHKPINSRSNLYPRKIPWPKNYTLRPYQFTLLLQKLTQATSKSSAAQSLSL